MNNVKSLTGNVPSEKYPDAYWMARKDGLCLCKRLSQSLIEAKTFITWEMAGYDQKEIAFKGQQFLLKNGFEVSLPEEDFEEFTKEKE